MGRRKPKDKSPLNNSQGVGAVQTQPKGPVRRGEGAHGIWGHWAQQEHLPAVPGSLEEGLLVYCFEYMPNIKKHKINMENYSNHRHRWKKINP